MTVREVLWEGRRVSAIVFVLLFAPFIAIRSRYYDLDPDIWWHIRVGDWIAANHSLPHVAIFSQYSERPWVPYSWCFELLVSRVHSALGLPGIPELLVCIDILISIVFLFALQRIAGSFWRSSPIAVFGILALDANPLRPMILTILFFIVELWIIFDAEQTGNDRVLYWLGPLFMLWANCHIQFVYGIAVIVLYSVSRIVQLVVDKPDDAVKSALRLGGICGISLVGSFIGPNGWLPYKVAIGLAGQPYVSRVIVELQAMNFRSPFHYLELLLVIAACFAAGRSRSGNLFRLALLIMTAFVSFRSLRDMWFAAIAASFVIAEAVRPLSNEIARPNKETISWRSEIASYGLAAVLALTISLGYGARHGMSAPDMMTDIAKVYPVGATEFIRDSHLRGPMYNSMNWGGFLIFNLRNQPVSLDPRTNIYGDQLLARSVATSNGLNWDTDPVLARSNFVILDRNMPLVLQLARNSEYRLVYEDEVSTVFVKQNGQKSSD